MKLKILFPCDYFDHKIADEAYRSEYEIAKSLGFECLLFDYDDFLETKKLNIRRNLNNEIDYDIIVYRGWMLKVDDYFFLDGHLSDLGYNLINPTFLYETFHHFDEIYYYIKNIVDTPKTVIISFDNGWNLFNPDIEFLPLNLKEQFTPLNLKEQFTDYFIMKDNVKSVKGTDFPTKISTGISDEELTKLVEKFKEYRGNLFTGEILLKQHVDLKKYGETTNEWRAFYFLEKVMTVSRNSNQPENCPVVPDELINNTHLTGLSSMFYTIDFAEKEDGSWILIETGDGQVSGLCPNQNILEFYTKIQNYWNEKYK